MADRLMYAKQRKKILLTGAGGFLGVQFIQHADSTDLYTILAVSSKETQQMESLVLKNTIFYSVDDIKSGNADYASCDALLHCAFTRSADGKELVKSLEFTNWIVSAATEANVKSIINISTQSVYDQQRSEPAQIESPPCPQNSYAVAKYASEKIIDALCKSNSVPVSHVRLGSLAGVGLDARLTTRFVRKALSSQDIYVEGGHQIISYLDVRDAAVALEKLLTISEEQRRKIYNIGADDQYTLADVAALVSKECSAHQEYAVNVEIREGGSFINLSMDSTTFKADAGWTQKYFMNDIVRRQILHDLDNVQK